MSSAVLPTPTARSPVARLLGLSMVARTPEAATGLLLILQTRALGGSFALAGAVSAMLAVGLAGGAPLLGRVIDRRGQTGVLTITATIGAAAIAVAGLLPTDAAPELLLGLALVAGIAAPPIGPCLRALFGHILPDANARHGALAMDAALQEVSFMAGPLLFVSALAAFSPATGLVAAGAVLLVGTLAFAAAPESREIPVHRGHRPRRGALSEPGVLTLLVVAAAVGTTYGAVEVALSAMADHDGRPAMLGLLMAIWGLPSLAAGLYTARRPAPADPARALVLYVTAVGGLTVLLAATPTLVTLALLLAVSGAFAAPMFATLYGLVGHVAAAGTVTEAFTWLGSGMFGGIGLGGALAGGLVSGAGPAAALVAGGVVGLLGAVLVLARIATLRQPTPTPSPAT